MLPLFEIQQLFTRLLSEPDTAALLSPLDPLTMEMIHRMAKDHEGQIAHFHYLKFDKAGSHSGSLWQASTCEVGASRLLDAIHILSYDRPTIERHLTKLTVAERGLYFAYMEEAEILDLKTEYGTVEKGLIVLAERHGSTFATFKKMRSQFGPGTRKRYVTIEEITKVKYFLPPEARPLADADIAAMTKSDT
jgi:hypothetical protein